MVVDFHSGSVSRGTDVGSSVSADVGSAGGSLSNAQTVDETARIAAELIRFDTTNWGGGRSKGETEAAEYLEAKLVTLGLKPQLFDAAPRRTSVVARVPGRNAAKPALVVHGHTDVVPAEASDWSVDPFAGVFKDGLLWGRGAVDMKNMDAMIISSLAEVLKRGGPERELIITFFADEEDTGVFGSHYLVREHPELFAGATEAISEVGGYSIDLQGKRAYLVQTGEKALVWVKLTATAPAGHGSRFVSENAVVKLARAVAAVAALEWPIILTATTRTLIAQLAELLGIDPETTGPDEVVLRTGSAAGFIRATLRDTVNPTVLAAGYKHNVIPERAEALIDIRPLPGHEADVLAAIRDAIGEDAELSIVQQDIGLENPVSSPLVDAARRVLLDHDPGATVLPYLMPAGTDNKALSELGIAGYGFTPLKLPADLDFPALFHGVDERVPLDALVFGREVLTSLLESY